MEVEFDYPEFRRLYEHHLKDGRKDIATAIRDLVASVDNPKLLLAVCIDMSKCAMSDMVDFEKQAIKEAMKHAPESIKKAIEKEIGEEEEQKSPFHSTVLEEFLAKYKNN